MAHLNFDGQWRFIWAVFQRLEIYIRTSSGWQIEKTIPDQRPYRLHVYAADLNRNGRDEIYWVTEGQTGQSRILECPTLATDTAHQPQLPRRATLRVFPTPAHNVASIFLDAGLGSRVRGCSVFDASGRVVLSQRLGREAGWIISVNRIRPGLYFLRADDQSGAPVATGRITIVR